MNYDVYPQILFAADHIDNVHMQRRGSFFNNTQARIKFGSSRANEGQNLMTHLSACFVLSYLTCMCRQIQLSLHIMGLSMQMRGSFFYKIGLDRYLQGFSEKKQLKCPPWNPSFIHVEVSLVYALLYAWDGCL